MLCAFWARGPLEMKLGGLGRQLGGLGRQLGGQRACCTNTGTWVQLSRTHGKQQVCWRVPVTPALEGRDIPMSITGLYTSEWTCTHTHKRGGGRKRATGNYFPLFCWVRHHLWLRFSFLPAFWERTAPTFLKFSYSGFCVLWLSSGPWKVGRSVRCHSRPGPMKTSHVWCPTLVRFFIWWGFGRPYVDNYLDGKTEHLSPKYLPGTETPTSDSYFRN